jgi:hypothetical protein
VRTRHVPLGLAIGVHGIGVALLALPLALDARSAGGIALLGGALLGVSGAVIAAFAARFGVALAVTMLGWTVCLALWVVGVQRICDACLPDCFECGGELWALPVVWAGGVATQLVVAGTVRAAVDWFAGRG